jgi:hypothetical protein
MARTHTTPQSIPVLAGLVVGLTTTWLATINAAVLLPALSLTTISPGQIVSGVVSLSAQADAAGLSTLQFQVSGQNVGSTITSGACVTAWDTRAMANGPHTITAVAADSAGNSVYAPPVVVTVQNAASTDTSAPTVSVSSPASGAVVSGTTTLTASASDGVGVAGVWFTIDGTTVGAEDSSAPYQTTWSTSSVPNGTHLVRALARDAAGNVGSSAAVTVTVSNSAADATAPSVSLTSPSAGSTVTGAVSLAATATDNVAVARVQFQINGSDYGAADTTAPFTASWDTASFDNGLHTIRAVATDAAGNTAISPAVTVTLNRTPSDPTPPVVSLTAPTAGATVTGTVNIAASASDNVGVTSVRFTLDGADIGADTSSPYSMSWSSANASNGTHVLRASAQDAAGNVTTSSGLTVTVSNQQTDTTLPTVSLTAPASGATVSGIVTVAASASDNVGVTSVQFTIDGANVGAPDTSAPWSLSWDTRTARNGSRVLRAIARDAAGNTRTSYSRTVTVNNPTADTVAPTVGVTTPSNGATVAGTVTIAASASDNVGVVGVQFMLNGTNIGGEDTSAPYSASWATSAVADGPQQIVAVARDAAGNRQSSTPVTVAVANETGSGVPGDLNGDDRPDLLFANASTGQLHAWFMNGYRRVGESGLSPERLPGGWQVAGIHDFTGDGTSDFIVEEPETGRVELWSMDRLTRIDVVRLVDEAGPWRVGATGDFDADGKADIIWVNPETGQLFYWLMNDAAVRAQGFLASSRPNPATRLAGAGDMNGDARTDLVWQNTSTGELTVWLMNGVTRVEARRLSPGSASTQWHIRAVADFDGNGHADIVWQHASAGYLYVWFMNRTSMTSQRFLSPAQVQRGWQVVGGR